MRLKDFSVLFSNPLIIYRDNDVFIECAHLYIRGEEKQHAQKLEEQYEDIEKYLDIIHDHNDTILPGKTQLQANF